MAVTQKEHLAHQYAIKLGPWLRFAVDQGDAEQVAELIGGLNTQQLMVLAVVLAADGPAPASRPDDGLVDEVAVRRVLDGQSVPLSPLEQSVAAKEMKRRGWARGQVMAALRVSQKRYRTLLAMPEQPSLFDSEQVAS
jgi:hypothetical protein